jgi:hypothetical protein
MLNKIGWNWLILVFLASVVLAACFVFFLVRLKKMGLMEQW